MPKVTFLVSKFCNTFSARKFTALYKYYIVQITFMEKGVDSFNLIF